MKVSIVIPSYGENVWQEMAETHALPSAYVQDPYEVLIGHDPEGTIASVRNGLAEKATGDWLLFLDADDELAPGFLEAMQRAERQERGSGQDPLLLTPAVSYVRKGKAAPPKFHPIGDLRQDNFLVVGTLVKKDLFIQVKGFEEYPHGFEDWSLWAKCWKAGARIIQVPRAIYLAHVNPKSKHREGWRNRKWQVETHMRVQRELFPEGV